MNCKTGHGARPFQALAAAGIDAATVCFTGGDVVTFDTDVHVYDKTGCDITEAGDIVEVL
jgi:hypothetical protein